MQEQQIICNNSNARLENVEWALLGLRNISHVLIVEARLPDASLQPSTHFMASSSWSFAARKGTDDSDPKHQSTKHTQTDLSALQSATTLLNEQFNKDVQCVPDIGDLLTPCMGYCSECLFFSDHYLASAQVSGLYSPFSEDSRVPFQKRRMISIPEGLFQYYSSA